MAKEQKTLLLVDGSSYLYRAFHAMPSLTNSKGAPTGAAYGICNMLRRILAERAPDYMAVVFDAKGKTFRDEMFAEYKATRPPMPDDLRSQIQPIHDLVDAMGIPRLVVPGVEADDVIGTLAREATALGINTVMSTSDKDMAQLVDEHVLMANTMDGSSLDIAGVEGKFGVPPQRIVDYLALIGDTSDNVPGVPKVGPKTAVKWLAEHGSLDSVIANADKVKGKVGESLREHLDQIPLSRELVTIRCDVPLDVTVDALLVRESDVARLRELYAQLEFKTWLSEVLEEGDVTPSAPTSEAHYETVFDEPALERWLQRLDDAALFSFSAETTTLNYMQAEIVGVSFSVSAGEAAYVPLAHHYAGVPPQLDRDSVLARLKPILEDPNRAKVGQNLKYDMSVLARHGIELAGARFDTMLESYVLDSTATRHDMDSLALKYLGHKTIHFEEVAGRGKKQLRFDEVPVEQAGPYAAEDADITLRLHHALWPKIRKQERLLALFRDLEMPLVPVLSQIERAGVKVDARLLAQQSAEVFDRLGELEQEAYEEAGQPFNLGSPKQLQVILFEQLNLPVISKTPKGQPSTAESVLQELAHDHALPHLILEHRALSKLRSTYLDSLPQCIDSATGRVHTSYHQAVASTGRLSSSDPNLQNIPVRRPEGRRVRQAFVAEDGCCLLAADYSQIELRIMAHLSADEGLVAAFAAGEDVHRATAAEVFGVELEEVTGEQRRNAKAINFGLIYGMSAFGLGRQLGIGRSEAQAYVDLYFERYPGVKVYMDRTREQAHETGFVETVFGRRLYLSEINASNGQRRQAAERTAINAPMQGTAADIIKRAMLSVQYWLRGAGLNARIIMQVHDELVLEVARDCVDEVREQVVELMSGAAKLDVALVVDTGVGANWDEAH
ncbi:MAG: DNA polymerase-1 [Gammaproteobacteria bacterium]|jgi:DNA polymerase-1